MSRRLTAALAIALYGLLGLVIGLGDFQGLIRAPLARFTELSLRPRGALWVQGLEGPDRLLDAFSLPLRALAVVLLLLAFWLLASLLTRGFRLTKPADQQPGRGVTSHLDVPQLFRAGFGALLSLWLLGGLAFLATLASTRGRPSPIPYLLLGGLPIWTAAFPFALGLAAHSLLAAIFIWWIWGPRGLVAHGQPVARRHQVLCALLAGAALAPAILTLHAGRTWLFQAAQALSIADRSGWTWLLGLTVALPAVALAYCAGIVALYRPRSLTRGTALSLTGFAAVVAVVTVVAFPGIRHQMDRLDLDYPGLAARLKLRASPLGRFALILTPNGGIGGCSAPDGSSDEEGNDRIICNGQSIDAVKAFLQERQYRTALASRAYEHLVSCYSLDWLSTRSLEASLAMMEHAPTPMALRMLQDKLGDCAITPQNRAILDAVGDPKRFERKDEATRRWLGFIYLRFGDMDKAREFLLNTGLTPNEIRGIFGGISPLTNGVVRGKMTVNSRPENGVRLGLIRVDRWPPMMGINPALQWRQVMELAHTNPQGEYEFRSIPEGRYVLVITGGGVTPNPRRMAQITPSPGLIVVNHMNRQVQVPTFDMRFVRRRLPPPQPEREPDGSTVRLPEAGGNNGRVTVKPGTARTDAPSPQIRPLSPLPA